MIELNFNLKEINFHQDDKDAIWFRKGIDDLLSDWLSMYAELSRLNELMRRESHVSGSPEKTYVIRDLAHLAGPDGVNSYIEVEGQQVLVGGPTFDLLRQIHSLTPKLEQAWTGENPVKIIEYEHVRLVIVIHGYKDVSK